MKIALAILNGVEIKSAKAQVIIEPKMNIAAPTLPPP